MLNHDTRLCNCIDCPGEGCRCGCQANHSGATLATPAACGCGTGCGCEGAEQGCLCQPRDA